MISSTPFQISHRVSRFRGGAEQSTDCQSSQDSIASQTSDGSRFTSNDSLNEMAGTSETLPCGISRDSQQPRVDLSALGTTRTVRWTLNNNDSTSSAPSQGNDIVLRFSDNNASGGSVRVDLASPEDISLGTDSSRAVGAFGSTV